MLVVPYSTALDLGRRTYVTFGVIFVCLLIHLLADHRNDVINDRLAQYCTRVAAGSIAAATTGYFEDSEELCQYLLYDRHEFGDERTFREYLYAHFEEEGTLEPAEVQNLLAEVERHYDQVAMTMPSFLQKLMAQYPPSLNPLPMLASSFSHSDWPHVLGNLVFFYAFAAPVEAVVGPLILLLSITALSLICGIAYSVFCFFTFGSVPTVGLSGVVMGMIGMAAFLIPRARVNTVMLSGLIGWRFAIPAWVLAVFFIASDLLDLFGGGMEETSVNFLSHVAGGLGGYLGAVVLLRSVRDQTQDDVSDAIEIAAIDRAAGQGSLSRERISRQQLANELRVEAAAKEKEAFSRELYRHVRTGNASHAQLLLVKEYDTWHRSPEIYEGIFAEIEAVKRGRIWLCTGRLCIHLYVATGRYGKAVAIASQLAETYPRLELATPSDALQIAHEAIGMNRQDLVEPLLRDPGSRYGGMLDTASAERLLAQTGTLDVARTPITDTWPASLDRKDSPVA